MFKALKKISDHSLTNIQKIQPKDSVFSKTVLQKKNVEAIKTLQDKQTKNQENASVSKPALQEI